MRRAAPWLVAALLLVAAAFMLLGLLPRRWTEAAPPSPPELHVEALTTEGSRATTIPRGGQIGSDGTLTILRAPPSAGRALPWTESPSQWSVQPQPFDPPPASMLAGVRGLFRVVPQPVTPQPTTMTLERNVAHGRLLLVRGCFRLDRPTGPLAVFPPGTRLGLVDGYLTVGPPGFPPALSARVGEFIFWEGQPVTRFTPASRRRIATSCGAGPAQTVVPASATVQQAANDGLAASNYSDRYGVSWADALAAVRRCRERLEQSLPPNPERGPMVDNPCGSAPPAPISDPSACPPGSKLTAGVCRTPEGFFRPIPEL